MDWKFVCILFTVIHPEASFQVMSPPAHQPAGHGTEEEKGVKRTFVVFFIMLWFSLKLLDMQFNTEWLKSQRRRRQDSRRLDSVVVFLVDKRPGYPASTWVNILWADSHYFSILMYLCSHLNQSADLVGAPAGEVDPPVVELQLDVSCSVSAVKTYKTALKHREHFNYFLSCSVFFSIYNLTLQRN